MNKMFSIMMLACMHVTCLLGENVTVTTAQELTDAINYAAQNATGTTEIVIVGTLEGNFYVPPTNHLIILKGKRGTNPTLDAQSQGTVLTIDLGATVIVKHLLITNGENTSRNAGGGVTNYGHAKLIHCTVSNSTSSTSNQYATLYGGGIFNTNQMTLRKCLITENSADRGGGIYNQNRMNIIHSEITDNTLSEVPSYGYGGGVFNDGYLKVSGSEINGNGAPNGYAGGVYTEGKMFISDSEIHHNSARNNCGGIENDVYLLMQRCDIHDNVAQGGLGGGVFNDYGDMVISHCKVYNNVAQDGDGGGIHNYWNLKVLSSLVRDNVSITGNGGGIANKWLLTVKRSTIRRNSAPNGEGGGIFNNGDNDESIYPRVFAKIKHSKIEDNSAVNGGGIANTEGAFMELVKSKVFSNTATSGAGGGGGIYTPSPSQIYIVESKVFDNVVDDIIPPQS